jgi:hypothetical protein
LWTLGFRRQRTFLVADLADRSRPWTRDVGLVRYFRLDLAPPAAALTQRGLSEDGD